MDDIPRVAIAIPLYIPLPRHPITRRKVSSQIRSMPIDRVLTGPKRYVLITVNLKRLGLDYVRMKTQWTVVYQPAGRQATGEPSIPATPATRGVTMFMPTDALSSPVYMFVNYMDGKRIRVRIEAVQVLTRLMHCLARAVDHGDGWHRHGHWI